jgi:hypothetical protein
MACGGAVGFIGIWLESVAPRLDSSTIVAAGVEGATAAMAYGVAEEVGRHGLRLRAQISCAGLDLPSAAAAPMDCTREEEEEEVGVAGGRAPCRMRRRKRGPEPRCARGEVCAAARRDLLVAVVVEEATTPPWPAASSGRRTERSRKEAMKGMRRDEG